jgi:hypothetical protein
MKQFPLVIFGTLLFSFAARAEQSFESEIRKYAPMQICKSDRDMGSMSYVQILRRIQRTGEQQEVASKCLFVYSAGVEPCQLNVLADGKIEVLTPGISNWNFENIVISSDRTQLNLVGYATYTCESRF